MQSFVSSGRSSSEPSSSSTVMRSSSIGVNIHNNPQNGADTPDEIEPATETTTDGDTEANPNILDPATDDDENDDDKSASQASSNEDDVQQVKSKPQFVMHCILELSSYTLLILKYEVNISSRIITLARLHSITTRTSTFVSE